MVKIKIGVITSAYPEFEDDPHGIFVHRLMREIAKEGHEVRVIAPHTGGKSKYEMDGVQVEKFHYFYTKRFEKLAGRAGMIDNVKEGWLIKFQVLTFLFFNIYYSLTQFRDVDVVHVHWAIPNGLGAYFLRLFFKIPYVCTVYGEEVYLSKLYKMKFALRGLINASSKPIAISKATLEKCVDIGLKSEEFEIIPYGVDNDFFRPLNIPRNDNYFHILSVGYLIERKGHEYLIRAMKEILKKRDDVRLKIVGSGPLEGKLKVMITDLGLDEYVEIIQNVSDDELLKLYNTSDLFVLPSVVDSQGNTEGLGIVLLEAMACGVNVIGSNVGGILDIIKDGENGFLVEEKDVDGLSTALFSLIEDKSLRMKISSSGSIMVKKRFSWEFIAERYIKIYSKLNFS